MTFISNQQRIITDWVTYTPSLVGSGITDIGTGVNAKNNGFWRRNGDSIDVRIQFRTGSSGVVIPGGTLTWGLPDGMTALNSIHGGTIFLSSNATATPTFLSVCVAASQSITGRVVAGSGSVLLGHTVPFTWGTDDLADISMNNIQISEFAI